MDIGDLSNDGDADIWRWRPQLAISFLGVLAVPFTCHNPELVLHPESRRIMPNPKSLKSNLSRDMVGNVLSTCKLTQVREWAVRVTIVKLAMYQ